MVLHFLIQTPTYVATVDYILEVKEQLVVIAELTITTLKFVVVEQYAH